MIFKLKSLNCIFWFKCQKSVKASTYSTTFLNMFSEVLGIQCDSQNVFKTYIWNLAKWNITAFNSILEPKQFTEFYLNKVLRASIIKVQKYQLIFEISV